MTTYYLTTITGDFLTVFADRYEVDRTTIFFYLKHQMTLSIAIRDLYVIQKVKEGKVKILWTNKKGKV